METITSRLEEYMTFKGLNANRVTVDAGLSNGLVGRAIKTHKGLHSDTIEKILLAYGDLSPVWLVMGEGEMVKSKNKNPLEALKGLFSEMIKEEMSGYSGQINELNGVVGKLMIELDEVKSKVTH